MQNPNMHPNAPPGMSHKGTTNIRFYKPGNPQLMHMCEDEFKPQVHLADDELFHTDVSSDENEDTTRGKQPNPQLISAAESSKIIRNESKLLNDSDEEKAEEKKAKSHQNTQMKTVQSPKHTILLLSECYNRSSSSISRFPSHHKSSRHDKSSSSSICPSSPNHYTSTICSSSPSSRGSSSCLEQSIKHRSRSPRSQSPRSRSCSPNKSSHRFTPYDKSSRQGTSRCKSRSLSPRRSPSNCRSSSNHTLSRQQTKNLFDEKKSDLKELFCPDCDVHVNNEAMLQSHITGKKHAKVLKSKKFQEIKKARSTLASTAVASKDTHTLGFPVAGKADVPVLNEGPMLQPIIDKCTNSPLVGLEFVKEIREKRISYKCELCNVSCSMSSIMPHLIGFKHQLRFLKGTNRDFCKRYKFRTKHSFGLELKNILREHEEKYGRKTIQVIEVECQVSTNITSRQ